MAVPLTRIQRQPATISVLGNLSLAWRYVLNESWKQKKNFFIGFTAIWLVVFSIAYVVHKVGKGPHKISHSKTGHFPASHAIFSAACLHKLVAY